MTDRLDEETLAAKAVRERNLGRQDMGFPVATHLEVDRIDGTFV